MLGSGGAIFTQNKSAGDGWRAAGQITIKEALIKTLIFKRLPAGYRD
jgi:hypothetical protein